MQGSDACSDLNRRAQILRRGISLGAVVEGQGQGHCSFWCLMH